MILSPTPKRDQQNRATAYLISNSNPRYSPPGVSILNAGQIALFEAQVWKRRKSLSPMNRPNYSAWMDNVGGDAVCFGVWAYRDRLFL